MIAIYTLTRDRLDYTKYCFQLLREKGGGQFVHYVLDNGSTDGTQGWLKGEYKPDFLYCAPTNLGLHKGSNLLRTEIAKRRDVDYVVKFDNDCEIVSGDLINRMATFMRKKPRFKGEWCLSPTVNGIQRPPSVIHEDGWNGTYINRTGIVGGLCKMLPFKIFCEYQSNEQLPLARGDDANFAEWFSSQGGSLGYIRGLEVYHYRTTAGQVIDYPEYFIRKKQEEK